MNRNPHGWIRADWASPPVIKKQQKPDQPVKRANSRERIIDAAIAVVQEDGARKLSLDAVAEKASMSKGGLLYHFKSKSALLQSMVARHVSLLDEAIEAAHAEIAKDKRPNALVRAYLHAFREKLCVNKKAPSGFLAAIAEEPALLNPVREHHARLLKEFRASSDNPELAMIAFLAVEGIWSLHLFATNPFSEPELLAHFDGLMAMLAEPARVSHGHVKAS